MKLLIENGVEVGPVGVHFLDQVDFQSRRHFLSAFSRAIASSMRSYA
jgi:hypothetical protein